MTVKELKKELENYDEHLEVFFIDSEWGTLLVQDVRHAFSNDYEDMECVFLDYHNAEYYGEESYSMI